MVESVVDSTSYEKKMDKSVASCGRLEVSISFGKYDNDSLSWEKFSTFSPNKYLEEVEKCATPGSVAEKKAYFEAHYKKIAARKAEQLDQEKHEEKTTQIAGDESSQDSVPIDGEFGYAPNSQSSVEGDPRETDVLNEVSSTHLDKLDKYQPITTICENLQEEEAKKQINVADGSLTEDRPVQEKKEQEKETPSKEPQETKESPATSNNEILDTTDSKKEKLKLTRAKESQKVALDRSKEVKKVATVKKEKNVVKKIPVSPVTKSAHITTAKMSKPAGTTPSTLVSRSSTKRTTGPLLPKGRILSAGESKKVVSKSLHMSLSLGPSSSNQGTPSITRRSLIMEQMGDKDIVKRAFKSFQMSCSQSKSSSEDISSTPKQMSTKAKQPKENPSMSPQKLIGSSHKTASQDKKNAKTVPAPWSLRRDEHVEKKKQATKKLVSNSKEKEPERIHIQAKTKGDKYSDMRKSRENINMKPLPVSSLKRGQKLSKSSLDEDNSNSKVR